MPRDLESEKATLEGMPPLSKEPDVSSPPDDPLPLYRMPTTLLEERFKRMKDLHPYALLLNQDDVDECDWLEHAAFDPHEAATREKVRNCSFISKFPKSSALCKSLPTFIVLVISVTARRLYHNWAFLPCISGISHCRCHCYSGRLPPTDET